MTATAYRSGWCGAAWHERCTGAYSGVGCDCTCHTVQAEQALRIGSLFSGYEGLGMAVQQVLGGELAWVSDIDAGACKILAHRFPDVPNIGDITAVDWATVAPVDVLTGGFPCQDVSAAGKRLGMKPGTRSGLWAQMAYAIAQLRPSLVVIENVRGLLSARADGALEPCPWCVGDDEGHALRALGGVLGDLASLGYDASWHGLRAADVGAPHGRFRVFVVAWPAHTQGVAGSLRDGDAVRVGRRPVGRAPHAGRGAPEDPDVAAGGERRLAAPGQAEGGRSRADAGRRGRAPAADRDGSGLEGAQPAQGRHVSGRGAAADASRDGRDEGRPEPARQLRGPDAHLGGTPAPADPYGVGRRSDLGCVRPGQPDAAWGPYRAAVRRWEQLTRPAPAPTEPGKTGQPRLSPAFVEWLMGLPAGHVTQVPGLSRNEQLKALGNGVVPQQAAEALRLLLADVAAPKAAAAA